MEDGMILVVVEEGLIADYKEKATEEEEAPVAEEEVVEEEVEAQGEKSAPKKTIESVVFKFTLILSEVFSSGRIRVFFWVVTLWIVSNIVLLEIPKT